VTVTQVFDVLLGWSLQMYATKEKHIPVCDIFQKGLLQLCACALHMIE
jgi:hypothetical protein